MPVLGFDLGGTKLAAAVFSTDGRIICEETLPIGKKTGKDVGRMIADQTTKFLRQQKLTGVEITSIGIAVPGISFKKNETVWAPNIKGWEEYPLKKEIQAIADHIPVKIESDRTCYILGESWVGNARGCSDAVYIAVGTGIGAGILVNGTILSGAHDIAGAIGWMAMQKPYKKRYDDCGCFESSASGAGITKMAISNLRNTKNYTGILSKKPLENLTAQDVFNAYDENDPIAKKIIKHCIMFWGMAVANLVSILNPQKIILGGGVFGPAVKFIPQIHKEAAKWAQPISMQKVSLEATALGKLAGLYGAGLLALQNSNQLNSGHE